MSLPRPAGDGPAPGSRFSLAIDGLASGGDGVGRHGGIAVFVPQSAPGDRLEVEVTLAAARYARARIRRVLRPGPDRVAPPCPVVAECGGCAWQHLRYEAQLAWKRTLVVEALRRLGHVQGPEALVAPTLPAEVPWRYRHKMAVPFAPGAGPGAPPRAGFYAARSHEIVPFESCAIQHPSLDRALAAARRLVAQLGVPVYDERTRRGDLRHLVGRVSRSGGGLLLCLVTARPAPPWARALAEGLMASLPECVGVVLNVNRSPGSAILGPETRPLAGATRLVEELDGLRFLVSAPSFFQVSPLQAAALYRTAVGQASPTRGETVFDLYAGVGTLSLYLGREAGAVEAVEEVPAAVADGRQNAGENGLGAAVRFHCGPAEEVVPRLLAAGARPGAVVLDPPRRGAAEAVLRAIAAAAPARVVYVSCNPATLARDVGLLQAAGFRLAEVRPVDMFPQTPHVECSALLVRAG
jgi:23S rRNA (uracil1939-C5)-methyltransferase